jgi:streptogramin lyase
VAQHQRGTVTRLREPSGSIVSQVELGPAGRSGPQGVTATKTGVWIGIPNIGSVVRVDPASNTVVATIKTETSPCGGIAVQAEAVWVSSCYDDHFAVRIDPRTNTNVAEIDIGGNNGGAVIIDGSPWFPVANRLVRIDPATNRIDRVVEFAPDGFLGFGSAIGFDAVWIGGLEPGQVARIPLTSLE